MMGSQEGASYGDTYDLPNAIDVEGIRVNGEEHKPVAMFGTDIDEHYYLTDKDILIASFPRTGTTWMSQIVSLLMAGKDNYESTKEKGINKRAFFVDLNTGEKLELDKMKEAESPRLVKTHLSYKFVNRWIERDGAKVIVPLRNYKDTLVSIFHFYMMGTGFGFKGTWTDFVRHVQLGKVYNGDPVDWMASWWNERNNDNILFVHYEDMVEDLEREVNRIIKFTGMDVSKDTVSRIVQDSTFDSMKKNKATNYEAYNGVFFDFSKAAFMRKGKVGAWKDFFTVAQNEWFDSKNEKKMEEMKLKMRYDL